MMISNVSVGFICWVLWYVFMCLARLLQKWERVMF